MNTTFHPSLNHWKTLYRAAIQETNKALLPQRVSERVSEAEAAVKARGCEIFYECVQNCLAAQRTRVSAYLKRWVMLLPCVRGDKNEYPI
jgi:hypothetical protein